MFILKQYNTPILKFDLYSNEYNKYFVDIVEYYGNDHLFPIDFDGSNESLLTWLKNRTIPSNRAYVSSLLSRVGLNEKNLVGIIKICRGLSLNDSYWVVEEGFDGDFYKYNLYTHKLSRILAWTAFSGTGSYTNKTPFRSSPEFTTAGMLAKCWRRIDGKLYLYKSGTTLGVNSGREPYSEFYASQIASCMGINHVDYSIAKWKGYLCSTCELFSSIDVSYVPIYRICENDLEKIFKFYKDLGPEFYNELISMFVFDAIICNEDRHMGNFGVLIDNATNKICAPAPVFDNGLSLFNFAMDDDIKNIETYAKTRSPRLYEDFVSFVKKFMTEEHKKQVRKLINFKFKKHPKYNLPDWWLKQIEDFIQIRVRELLD